MLALMHLKGYVVNQSATQNIKEYSNWIKKAAEQGHDLAILMQE